MTRTGIPTILALAIVLGCSESAIAPSAQSDFPTLQASVGSQVVHRVTAGGPDVCTGLGAKPGCDANYSLVALQRANGSVSGLWHDQFSQPFGGVHVTVNCLLVAGNEAWISGLDRDGVEFTTMVRDNGTSANDPPDQIGFTIPSVFIGDCNAQFDFEGNGILFDAPQGQTVVVQ